MRGLVVGAGPTGLTAAVELARRGVVPELIERRAEGSGLSRAVGILPESLRMLAPSGVTERLLDEGMRLGSVRLFEGQRLVVSISLAGGDPDHDYLLALPQDRTEALLRDAFVRLGGRVEFGVECTSLVEGASGVTVQTGGGSRGPYDFVIGADGTRSVVRSALGLPFDGLELDGEWSIADVDARDWPHDDAFTVCRVRAGGVAVVAPLEVGRYRVVSNTLDALAVLPLPLDVQRVRRAGAFRIAVRQASAYRVGRVFLAGDAAHCHSPVGGRGMNLGIADAAELARLLVEGQWQGYDAARRAEAAAVIALSERARKVLTSRSRLTRAGVATGLRLVRWLPGLGRSVARTILGDDLSSGE